MELPEQLIEDVKEAYSSRAGVYVWVLINCEECKLKGLIGFGKPKWVRITPKWWPCRSRPTGGLGETGYIGEALGDWTDRPVGAERFKGFDPQTERQQIVAVAGECVEDAIKRDANEVCATNGNVEDLSGRT